MNKRLICLSLVGIAVTTMLMLSGCGTVSSNVDTKKELQAESVTYSVKIATNDGGTVTIYPQSPDHKYPAGTEIQLEPTPENSTWVFYGRPTDFEGNINSTVFTVEEEVVATLNFLQLT